MELDREGQENAYFGHTDLPTAAPPAEVHLAGEWRDLAEYDGTELARVAAEFDIPLAEITAGTARIDYLLVAGPDVTVPDPEAVVLALGRNLTKTRFIDTSEILIRPADFIDVV